MKQWLGALIAGVLVGGIGYAVWTQVVPHGPDSHAYMLEELRLLQEVPTYQERLFGTASQQQRTEEKLAGLPESAPPSERIKLLSTVAAYQLAKGQGQQAAETYLEAARRLEPFKSRLAPEVEERAWFDVAVSHLRWGEIENCLERTTCQSCLLPIRGEGVHTQPRGSLGAIDALNRLLAINPDHVTGRWLLNLAHMTVGTYPEGVPPQFLIDPERFTSEEAFPKFENVAASLGLDTVSLSGGIVVDDFNGDHRLDVLTSDWSVSGPLRYFEHQPDGSFVERSQDAGLEGLYGGLNLVQADYDNDGDLDVLVLRGAWLGQEGRHPNSLLANDGRGNFRDVTLQVGLAEPAYPTQTAAWADFDLDGDLDLYIGNEDFPSQLFENDGSGHFTDIAAAAGVTNDRYTKGVTWGDYNQDRLPDLYVSNFGTPDRFNAEDPRAVGLFATGKGQANRLYRNNGDGTFTDVAEEVGVGGPMMSFPTWFWDYNNDGNLDLFVATFAGDVTDVAAEYLGRPTETEQDVLYRGDGQGGWVNVSNEVGLTRTTLTMGANFGDLDGDGFDDFYLGTGTPEYEGLTPNLMFHNQQGKHFADVTTAGGFGHLQKGHAIAFADLDADGDQDVLAVMGGAYDGDFFKNAVFENPGFGHHWLGLKLRGTQSNRSAIGARIHVEVEEDGSTRSIYKWVNSGGSFGANPLQQTVGLGQASRIRRLEIDWPATGKTQRFDAVPLDQYFEIVEGDATLHPLDLKPLPFPGAGS